MATGLAAVRAWGRAGAFGASSSSAKGSAGGDLRSMLAARVAFGVSFGESNHSAALASLDFDFGAEAGSTSANGFASGSDWGAVAVTGPDLAAGRGAAPF